MNLAQSGYPAKARELLNATPGGAIQGFVRSNGDVLRYNIQTNEFAVRSADGTIRTLFRPGEGLQYWLGQIGGMK